MPLLPIIASLAPSLVKWALGDSTGAIAQQVADAAVEVFGTSDPKDLDAAIAKDPAAALALKSKLLDIQDAESERMHKERMAEMADIGSARQREVATGDHTPRILAFATLGVFLVVNLMALYGCYQLLTSGFKVTNTDLAIAVAGLVGTILGWVNAKADMIYNYFFGSSSGSKAKTEQLSDAMGRLGTLVAKR